MANNETDVRSRLGIPGDAERVVVFTESSHWDPDWLVTSKSYFRLWVRRQLDAAIRGLIEEPRRVYSAECAFYVRMYWEARPERQDAVRDLVNSGRLRLTGSGVTTPDTLIPSAESLIRDYLVGQEWYRSVGITAEPDVAYFPDSFGHSPAMPTLMRAVGVTGVAVCRIDGMYFIGCESELPGGFPREGSSAELLAKKEKSQDFVWRSPDGTEILAHWVAYGYGQGELLAHAGATRASSAPLAVPMRTDSHVARRIEGYAKKLSRHARTPYLLCPIGFDFSDPITRLLDLLDRYNQRHYPSTGIWVVNAGLDDYLALVGCHRDRLPVVDFDPNPYFTGFYTSRRSLKSRCRALADALIDCEARAVAVADPEVTKRVREELAPAWWIAATSNHHDFITGTAPDRVVRKEQMPWLDEAVAIVRRVGNLIPQRSDGANGALLPDVAAAEAAKRDTSVGDAIAPGDVTWQRDGTRIVITASFGSVVFDEELGGAMTSVKDSEERELLGPGPAFDIAVYSDWGGLWRTGNEYWGGRFDLLARASEEPATLEVSDGGGNGIEVAWSSRIEGASLRRTVRAAADPNHPNRPRLDLRATVEVANDRAVTALFPLGGTIGRLVTDVPGGVAERPSRHLFDPTYWSVQSFVHARTIDGDGVAALLARPGAAAVRSMEGAPDQLEVVLARNATKERFLAIIPMLGFPARGHDPGPHDIEISLAFTGRDWREEGLVREASRFSRRVAGSSPLTEYVGVDCPDVAVTSVKPADRGEGVVVRLWSYAPAPKEVTLTCHGLPAMSSISARRCDGRERDLEELGVKGGAVKVLLEPGISSLRLVPS